MACGIRYHWVTRPAQPRVPRENQNPRATGRVNEMKRAQTTDTPNDTVDVEDMVLGIMTSIVWATSRYAVTLTSSPETAANVAYDLLDAAMTECDLRGHHREDIETKICAVCKHHRVLGHTPDLVHYCLATPVNPTTDYVTGKVGYSKHLGAIILGSVAYEHCEGVNPYGHCGKWEEK